MSTLGPRTALKDRKISGSLAYILSQTNVKQGTKAAPNDVAGCTLEMGADGKWVGTLGSLSKAAADALYASGALANLATGATYRDMSGTQYTYSAGWVFAKRPIELDSDALMCFGDSIIAAGFESGQNPSGTGVYCQLRESIETIMNRLLGFKRFRRLYNYGYAGFSGTTFSYQPGDAGYNATYDGKMLIAENNAEDMILAFGTNDLGNESLSPEQICANLLKLATWGTEAGKRVHIRGILPRGIGFPGNSDTWRARALRLNQLLKTACRKNDWKWIPVVEAYTTATSLTEWSVPWGESGLELLWDGVHPSRYGNYVGALVMRDHFSAIRSDRKDIGASHYLDSVKNDAANTQLVKNPRFNGVTDWILPQPGGVFTSVAYSTIPSPDGVGNALAIDMQYNGAGDFGAYQLLDTINIAKGTYISASAAIQLQGLNGSGSPIGYHRTFLGVALDYTNAVTGQSLASSVPYSLAPPQNRWESPEELTVIDLAPITPAMDVLPGRLQRIDFNFATKSAGSCRIVLYAIQATIQDPIYGAIPWRP